VIVSAFSKRLRANTAISDTNTAKSDANTAISDSKGLRANTATCSLGTSHYNYSPLLLTLVVTVPITPYLHTTSTHHYYSHCH